MLSVINRGTITGSEVEEIPYQIIDGYSTGSYGSVPLELIKLNGISKPLTIIPNVDMASGYLHTDGYALGNVGMLKPTVQAVVVSGYKEKTVTPTEG